MVSNIETAPLKDNRHRVYNAATFTLALGADSYRLFIKVLPSLKLQIAGTAFIFIDRHCFTSRWCDDIKKGAEICPGTHVLKALTLVYII